MPPGEMNLIQFGLRIKSSRESLKLSQQDLADKVKTSKSMISSYENGESDPRQSMIPKLAKALGVGVTWLMLGNRSSEESTIFDKNRHRLDNAYKSVNRDGQGKIADYAEDVSASGNYPVSDIQSKPLELKEIWHRYGAAAGNGYLNGEYDEPTLSLVTTEDVPRHDEVIKVYGDSMSPTISNGDIAYLRFNFEFQSGQIYAVNLYEDTVIKRCSITAEGFLLVSDNPDKSTYPNRIIKELEDVAIVGRVVGWSTPV